VDNHKGGWLGVRHLIDCGYDRIGILSGYDRLSTMRERLAGYYQALREAGLPARPEWVIGSPLSIEGGRGSLRQLMSLPDRPRAVFISNNLLALGALLEMRAMGIRCPDDLALVSFDDHPWAAVSDPPLTVVRQPAQALGRMAASILLALIKHEPVDSPRALLECELVIRQSSRALAQ
jgi:DNA-binding LacI/PurR family transcriptional regulator